MSPRHGLLSQVWCHEDAPASEVFQAVSHFIGRDLAALASVGKCFKRASCADQCGFSGLAICFGCPETAEKVIPVTAEFR